MSKNKGAQRRLLGLLFFVHNKKYTNKIRIYKTNVTLFSQALFHDDKHSRTEVIEQLQTILENSTDY